MFITKFHLKFFPMVIAILLMWFAFSPSAYTCDTFVWPSSDSLFCFYSRRGRCRLRLKSWSDLGLNGAAANLRWPEIGCMAKMWSSECRPRQPAVRNPQPAQPPRWWLNVARKVLKIANWIGPHTQISRGAIPRGMQIIASASGGGAGKWNCFNGNEENRKILEGAVRRQKVDKSPPEANRFTEEEKKG